VLSERHCCTSPSGVANAIFNCPCPNFGPDWPRLPVSDTCLSAEFDCALDSECRQCLLGIYTSANTINVLSSPFCGTPAGNVLQNVNAGGCIAYPQCTIAKQQCTDDPLQKCPICLDMMRDGDVVGAMRRCSSSTADSSAALLGTVVFQCMSNNDVTCTYFKARCYQDETCRNCLAVTDGAKTAHGVAESFLNSPFCMSTLGSNSSSEQANNNLYRVFVGCPFTVFAPCQAFTAMCILRGGGGDTCATCLAGSVAQQNDPICEPLLHAQFEIYEACQPCSNSVYENNHIVLATSIVGGMSILPCVVVILVIIAYGKDLMYIRSRIIIGLMMSNIVYSIANTIPVDMLDQTSDTNCARVSLSFNTIRFGRALWFAGKYALVFFELLILGVTSWGLRCGLRGIGVHREALLHATCTLVGMAAFIGFFVKSGEIESDGYNAATLSEVESGAFSYIGANDDRNDD
jgi:hypothetical protein